MSAGVRTAPTVNGAPVTKIVSYSVIDVYKDVRTESFLVDGAATPAQIEALIAAVAAGCTGSLFEVKVQEVYAGARQVGNATGLGRQSADDKLFVTVREPSLKATKRLYVPAPAAELFQANSEIVDTTDQLFIDITNALTPLLGTYTFSTVSFTERSESNTPTAL